MNDAWGTTYASWDALLQSRGTPDRQKAAGDLERFYSTLAEQYFKVMRETIKEVEDKLIVRTVARAQLRRALTPQSFHFDILKRAYDDLSELESAGVDVTDDSFLVERLGVAVTIVEGNARNIKITTREDLALAEAILTV